MTSCLTRRVSVKLCETVQDFLQETVEFRALESIRLNLISTIALSYSQRIVNEKCYWWILLDDQRIVGIALKTGHQPMILSPMSMTASEAFAHYILQQNVEFTAVNGPQDTIDSFLDTYIDATRSNGLSLSRKLKSKQLIYEVKHFQEPTQSKGSPHQLTHDDIEIGAIFLKEFNEEVKFETNFDLIAFTRAKVEAGLYWFWIDIIDGRKTIVALGGHSFVVANQNGEKSVGRIGPIYTRPLYRSQGYGSHLTAFLTSKLLTDHSCRVMLFADEANPSSNKVYRRLGYEVLGENVEFSLLFDSEDFG
jgi:predicted GNAT family acetyltransferase